jgi:hypothetical protein
MIAREKNGLVLSPTKSTILVAVHIVIEPTWSSHFSFYY